MPARVRILYDVEGWAYHGRALALQRYAPADLEIELGQFTSPADEATIDRALGGGQADVLVVLCQQEVRHLRQALDRRGWPTRLVGAWNRGWPNQAERFPEALAAATHGLIVNNRGAWWNAGRLPGTHFVPNGVDLEVFRMRTPPRERPRKVLWMGSEHHRKIKGHDDLIVPLFARLEAEGVPCEALLVDSRGAGRRSAAEMATWYDGGAVLVVASASEGTPNTALEAAACGCTVVSTRVGNMPELIRDGENGFLVDRDGDALFAGVMAALARYPELSACMQRDIQAFDWRERSRAYHELLRFALASPVGAPEPAPAPWAEASIVIPLLRQEDAWLDACVRSALGQTVPTEVIVVVSPMTPASNRALLERLAAGAGGRLVILESPPGAGFAGALNAGFRRASAARVGMLLSDDWLEPAAVATCLPHDADVVATGRVAHDASGGAILWSAIPDAGRYHALPTLEARASYLGHFLLVRRAALFAVGGVDPTVGLTGADDYDMLWCLLERGASVAVVPEALYHYRDHDRERLTLRKREDQIADLEKILRKHGVGEPERGRLIAAQSRWFGEPCHVVLARLGRERAAHG